MDTKEIAIVAHGFVDLDLDGDELYDWCLKNGADRTPGAKTRSCRNIASLTAKPSVIDA